MKQTGLSIIIPCFNCEKTLKAAFDSCYEQQLERFEIVMVDDASTDGTRALMTSLASGRSEVKIAFHEKNRGGGAARNTAVENAKYDVIFCLDSDDMLPPGTLSNMLALLLEKKCDGVGIHRSIKFKGDDKSDISHVNTFGYIGEPIPLESLFEKESGPFCPLYSTFMFTKRAFAISGGYPVEHGFDTQGFAWRFLTNGLIAYTCPDAEYLHRVNFNRSYYIREYESGRVNYNWFKVLIEASHLFSREAKEALFALSLQSEINIYGALRDLSGQFDRASLYLAQPLGAKRYADTVKDARHASPYDIYWLGMYEHRMGQDDRALTTFRSLRDTPAVALHAQLAIIEIEGRSSKKSLAEIAREIEKIAPFEKHGSLLPLPMRAFKKAKCIAKKSVKGNPALFTAARHIFWLYLNIMRRMREGADRRKHVELIERIKKDKKIVVDLQFGGLGDCLVWTTLPRLLSERYGVSFYLSEKSRGVFRNQDIFKLCFESNPYFKGFSDAETTYKFEYFESEKKPLVFLTNKGDFSAIEIIERQFGLDGNGVPEIFYKPKKIARFENIILVDKNYISGKKLGWHYHDESFEREAKKHGAGANKIAVEHIDPAAQTLFEYVDMIYSCKHFITVLSGGAALAASLDKPFTAILPYDTFGGSVDQFVFKKSRGYYVK